MIFPDILRGHGSEADFVEDGAIVPGLADAVSVHIAHPHIGHHLWWWHHDIFNVFEGVNAVGGEPVIEPHRVSAGREGLRKYVFAFFLGD